MSPQVMAPRKDFPSLGCVGGTMVLRIFRCVVTRSLFKYYARAKEQKSSQPSIVSAIPSVIEAKVLCGTDIPFTVLLRHGNVSMAYNAQPLYQFSAWRRRPSYRTRVSPTKRRFPLVYRSP